MKLVATLAVIAAVCLSLAPCEAKTASLPADVKSFAHDYELCQHFSGEDAYSPERQKEITDGSQRYCEGIEERLAKLQMKYRSQPSVLARLNKAIDQ